MTGDEILSPAECRRRREALGWTKKQLAHEARLGFRVADFEAGRAPGYWDFGRRALAAALDRGEKGTATGGTKLRPQPSSLKRLSEARSNRCRRTSHRGPTAD